MIERRTKEIALFGEKLILSERLAGDVQALEIFWEAHKAEPHTMTEVIISSISSALQGNIDRIPKWRIVKRAKMRKLLNRAGMINRLTIAQLHSLWEDVLRLEDPEYDNKKKAMNPQTEPLTG
jgi:hypothetical protein